MCLEFRQTILTTPLLPLSSFLPFLPIVPYLWNNHMPCNQSFITYLVQHFLYYYSPNNTSSIFKPSKSMSRLLIGITKSTRRRNQMTRKNSTRTMRLILLLFRFCVNSLISWCCIGQLALELVYG